MKVTKQYLKQIIKEQLEEELEEQGAIEKEPIEAQKQYLVKYIQSHTQKLVNLIDNPKMGEFLRTQKIADPKMLRTNMVGFQNELIKRIQDLQ